MTEDIATPLTDEELLHKTLHHMIHKAKQHFVGGRPVGYIVPIREFERTRTKYDIIRRARYHAKQAAAEENSCAD